MNIGVIMVKGGDKYFFPPSQYDKIHNYCNDRKNVLLKLEKYRTSIKTERIEWIGVEVITMQVKATLEKHKKKVKRLEQSEGVNDFKGLTSNENGK